MDSPNCWNSCSLPTPMSDGESTPAAFPQFQPPTPCHYWLLHLTFYSTNTKQFSKSFLLIFMLSFSKVCLSFEMVKDNSVFLSCIPLDILYFTRHRWCLPEFVCHAAFLKHQKWKAKNTLGPKRGVSTAVCFLNPEERARTLCPQATYLLVYLSRPTVPVLEFSFQKAVFGCIWPT